MLEREEIQSLLPQGLQLGQRHHTERGQGLLYDALDQRLAASPPLRRFIRILESTGDESWHVDWYADLRKLAKQHLSGVCRPLEVGRLGPRHVYLVLDWYPAVLKDRIPVTGVEKPRLAWAVLEQLARGLAELHDAVGPHGDLRAEHIFLDTPQLTEQSRTVIGHAELTNLPQWTNGALLCPESRKIFPPEWRGQLGHPSPKADVYALGLLAIELLAGPQAVEQLSQGDDTGKATKLTFRRRGCGKLRRDWILQPLLADEPRRFKDGAAVLQRLRFIRWVERGIIPASSSVLVAGLLLIGLFVWFPLGARETIKQLQLEAVELVAQRAAEANRTEDLERRIRSQEIEIAEQQKKNEEFEKIIRDLQGPSNDAQQAWTQLFAAEPIEKHDLIEITFLPPEIQDLLSDWKQICQQAWESCSDADRKPDQGPTRRHRAYLKLVSAPWDPQFQSDVVHASWWDFCPKNQSTDLLLQKQQVVYGKISNASWLKPQLKACLDDVMRRHADWVRWETQPPELIQPWKDCSSSPWDEQRKQRADAQLVAFQLAEKAWIQVVARKDLKWNPFQEQVRTAVASQDTDGRARRVVDMWIDQFNGFANPDKKAAIRLISGTSPKGSGTYREVTVGSETWRHDWTTETGHTYSPPLDLLINWQPDAPIRFLVYGERQTLRAGLRPNYMDQSFSGPVALWALHQAGLLKSGEHTFTLQVMNCPGPPPLPEAKHLKALFP